MKILTDFNTSIEGDTVTITCKVVEGQVPGPLMQNTALHIDDKNKHHISHIQMSNHGFFIKVPNRPIGVAIPSEQWIMKVARVIEPLLNPPEVKK